MRILLALALLLLVGCPAKPQQDNKRGAVKPSSNPVMQALSTKLSRPYPLKQIQADEFPLEAAAYLEASLKNLMSGGEYAPKDMTLAFLGFVPGSQIGRAEVLREVEISGEMLTPPLISAYMAIDPENCLEYIQRQVRAGQLGNLAAIGPDKEVGEWVYEHIHLPEGDNEIGGMLLDTIMVWELDPTPYLPSIRGLLESEDVILRYRALGYLVSKDLASLEEKQLIVDGLKSDDMMKFVGGIEAIKLSKDPYWAEELISVVAEAKTGDLAPDDEPDMKALYAAFGLSSLSGEQAKLLRQRLVKSTMAIVRLEASLGELKHGDSSHWNKIMQTNTTSDDDFLAALQSPDAWHLDLLPIFSEMSNSDAIRNRLLAADGVSRYKEHSDNKDVLEILGRLLDDEDPLVRERSWMVATMLCPEKFVDQAISVLADDDEVGKVKLMAAISAMQPTIKRMNGRE